MIKELLGWCECCAEPITKIPFNCPGCKSYYDENYNWTGKAELTALHARCEKAEQETGKIQEMYNTAYSKLCAGEVKVAGLEAKVEKLKAAKDITAVLQMAEQLFTAGFVLIFDRVYRFSGSYYDKYGDVESFSCTEKNVAIAISLACDAALQKKDKGKKQ